MLIRNNMLTKNQDAGCLDESPLRTVHKRPPKKIAPSTPPARNARANVRVSFIVSLLIVPHGLVFLGTPVPGVETAERKPGYQERKRPGMFSRMMLVQPDSQR